MKNCGKNKEKVFFDWFWPVCTIKTYLYHNFFWEFIVCLTPFFTDSLDWRAALFSWRDFLLWQWLLWKKEKDNLSVIIATVATSKKIIHQKLESYWLKISLKKIFYWISARWDKILQPQKCKSIEKWREN